MKEEQPGNKPESEPTEPNEAPSTEKDEVDEQSEESFPASDPPSY